MTRFERCVDWIVLRLQRKGAGFRGPYAALEYSRERADGFKHEAAAWRRRAVRAEFQHDDAMASLVERVDPATQALVESQPLAADGRIAEATGILIGAGDDPPVRTPHE